jgi:hypothetical protein
MTKNQINDIKSVGVCLETKQERGQEEQCAATFRFFGLGISFHHCSFLKFRFQKKYTLKENFCQVVGILINNTKYEKRYNLI